MSKFLLGYEDLELWFFGMKVGSFIICGGYDVREYATKCKFKYHKKKKKKKRKEITKLNWRFEVVLSVVEPEGVKKKFWKSNGKVGN